MVDWDKIGATDDQHLQQKWWSQAIGKKSLQNLLEGSSPRDQARLMEQQTGIGVSVMAATTSLHAHTKIQSDHYRLGLRWWLGKPLVSLDDPLAPVSCPGGCEAEVDEFGDHILCCKHNNFQLRHNDTQQAIA